MTNVAARRSQVLIGHGVHAQYTEVLRTRDDVLLLNSGNHVFDRLSSATKRPSVFRCVSVSHVFSGLSSCASALWHAPVHMKHANPQSMHGSEAQRQQSGLRQQLECETVKHLFVIIMKSSSCPRTLYLCGSLAFASTICPPCLTRSAARASAYRLYDQSAV